MIRLIAIVLFIFLGSQAFAQGGRMGGGGRGQQERTRPQSTNATLDMDVAPKGNAKISGNIVDSDLTTAVEYATVALINATNGKTIDGTLADDKGKFELKKIADGTYTISVSFVGYETLKVDGIKVEKGKDVDLGVVKLSASSIALEGVTITGDKPLVEEKVDRLVYNAEKDLSAAGGDASDVLKNVPMLNVDLDGNVSLRGSENIQVLINNKPSTIIASSIADALKMIPSELIKSVEVITSPSARYDAEGTAGIINIITKKSSLKGLNLNFNAGLGNRASNLGFNGNYRTGKLGISFGGYGRAMYNKSKDIRYSENRTNGRITDQNSEGRTNGMFGRYNLGFDYDLGNNQTLFGTVSLGNRSFKRYTDQNFNYFENTTFLRNELRDLDALNVGNTLDYSLDYLKIFESGKELSLSAMYSNTDAKTDNYTNFLSGSSLITKKQWNDNDNLNDEWAFQVDYLNPIGKNQQIEIGAKSILRTIDSKYLYLIDTSGVNQDRDSFLRSELFEDPENPGGGLKYDQNIYAAYASYTFSTKDKLNIKLGGRFEYTTIEANQSINQLESGTALSKPFADEYPIFVPSLNVSKPFGVYTAKFSYNYRISRPGLREINPNIDMSDPLDVNMGRSDLDPEKTHNAELTLSRNIGKSYFSVSTFGRYSGNDITRVSMTASDAATRFPNIAELQNLDAAALVTTYENIGKETTIGFNFYGNVNVNSSLNFNANIDGYYKYIKGQQWEVNKMVDDSNDGFAFSARGSANLKLEKNWSLQADAGWRGRRISLQGEYNGSPRYGISVRKQFNKNLSLGFGADNFFGRIIRKSESETGQFIQRNTSYRYERNIRLNVNYKIGNMRFVANKRRGVKNDDQTSGEDDV